MTEQYAIGVAQNAFIIALHKTGSSIGRPAKA